MTTINFATILVASATEVKSSTGMFDVSTTKVLRLKGPVNKTMAEQARKDIAFDTDIASPRLVLIDTSGGSVAAGQWIMDKLKAESRRTGQPIWCLCTGRASSMGFTMMSQCHYRLGLIGTHYFFHRTVLILEPSKTERLFSIVQLRRMLRDLEESELPYTELDGTMLGYTPEEYVDIADSEQTYGTDYVRARGWLDDIATVKE